MKKKDIKLPSFTDLAKEFHKEVQTRRCLRENINAINVAGWSYERISQSIEEIRRGI